MQAISITLESVRGLLSQEASIPALRALVFLVAVLSAFAWLRRRPNLALVLAGLGALLGLGYWLIQIASPFGLGTNASLTNEWAQAGVNALAQPKGEGFVRGTEPALSLLGAAAMMGVPFAWVQILPQIFTLLWIGLMVMVPMGLIRNRTTARFSACILVAGGVWPSVSPFGALLVRPSSILDVLAFLVLLLGIARSRAAMRLFRRSRFVAMAALIGTAAFTRSLQSGAETGAIPAFLLVAALVIMAAPLRVLLRRVSPSSSSRRFHEAAVLLVVSAGSGLLWWNPQKSVPGFIESQAEGSALRKPMDWIAINVGAGDVVLASPIYSGPIAALAGRRVLFGPLTDGAPVALPEPFKRNRLMDSALRGAPIARLAEGFSATHLLLGPGERTPPAQSAPPADNEPRLALVLVYEDAEDFRVFRLAKK